MNELLIAEAMKEVRKGAPEEKIMQRYGPDAYREASKRVGVERNAGRTLPQLYAKQEAERRQFFKELASQGTKTQRVSQQDHNYIVDSILRIVDDGNKPEVPALLKAYGHANGREANWAKRVATQKHGKKIGRSLQSNMSHPVIQDMKGGRMLSQTFKGALQRCTYSGFAELLFTGSQIVRSQRCMQMQIDELRKEIAIVKADTAKANARLDCAEQWKIEAVEMYSNNMSYGKIAERLGKAKSTINDYIRTMIKAGSIELRA